MELNQLKQRLGESARELGNRIKNLASLAFRGKDRGSKATREEMSLNSFTLALHRKNIGDAGFGAEFSNLSKQLIRQNTSFHFILFRKSYKDKKHRKEYIKVHLFPLWSLKGP